jgi:hypothetical protein
MRTVKAAVLWILCFLSGLMLFRAISMFLPINQRGLTFALGSDIGAVIGGILIIPCLAVLFLFLLRRAIHSTRKSSCRVSNDSARLRQRSLDVPPAPGILFAQ